MMSLKNLDLKMIHKSPTKFSVLNSSPKFVTNKMTNKNISKKYCKFLTLNCRYPNLKKVFLRIEVRLVVQ